MERCRVYAGGDRRQPGRQVGLLYGGWLDCPTRWIQYSVGATESFRRTFGALRKLLQPTQSL